MREPTLAELELWENPLLQEQGCSFVTLYINGEVRGSAWNIKEISPNIAEEIRLNTLQALTWDKRFTPITLEESETLKFRVDQITNRTIIGETELQKLDPTKHGVIAIQRTYDKVAVILPNISPKLMNGADFIPVLKQKLDEKEFKASDYIIYQIETNVETNY